MHDQPPYPFHEQPTDDPVTGSAAQCGDPLQADSRQHPSLEYPLVVPEVKRSRFFTPSRAFAPSAKLLSAARGALSRQLLGRGRVIPIGIN